MHAPLTCISVAVLAATAVSQVKTPPMFAAPVSIGDLWSRVDTLVDLDRDGDLDAAGFFNQKNSTSFAQASWMENLGDGTFGPRQILFTEAMQFANSPNGWVAAGDWDGDGWQDIAVAHRGTVRPFHSSTNGPVSQGIKIGTLHSVGHVAVGDFDGDGSDDLMVHGIQLQNGFTAEIWRNDFATREDFVAPGELAPLDATGDGVADLAAVFQGTTTFWTLGSGLWSQAATVNHSSFAKPMSTAGDIDGDGDDDLVIFDGATGEYQVVRCVAASQFTAEAHRVGGPATHLIDVDGDGDLDGLCCGSGGSGTSPANNSGRSEFHISLFTNGGFAPASVVVGMGSRRFAGVMDLDGDGNLDLVGGNTVLHNSDGFAALQGYIGGISPVVPAARNGLPTSQTGFSSFSELADFNRDGAPDVLDSRAAGNQALRMLRNDGSGSLVGEPLVVQAPPAGMRWDLPGYAGDFDGDGDEDLVVATVTTVGPAAFQEMYLLANTGTGTFHRVGPAAAAGVSFAAPGSLGGANQALGNHFVIDYDSDGDLDLVTQLDLRGNGVSSGAVRVMANDGAGFFTLLDEWSDSVVEGFADLDGDGLQDMLLARGDLSGAGVRFGSGSGGYDAVWTALPVTSGVIHHMKVGQFDGDQELEIAVLELTAYVTPFPLLGSRVDILDLQGGAFAVGGAKVAFQNLEVYKYPSHVHLRAADLDGDGLTDLMAGPLLGTPDRFAIARATAHGIFADPVIQIIPGMRGATDIDGDGDLDLLGDRVIRNIAGRDLPHVGARQRFGSGTPGTQNVVPSLGSQGPLTVGSVSTVTVHGGVGGGWAVLGVSPVRIDQPGIPLPGMTLYPSPDFLIGLALGGAPGVPGVGDADWSGIVPPALAGFELFAQAMVFDPGAQNGLSQTAGMRVVHGF